MRTPRRRLLLSFGSLLAGCAAGSGQEEEHSSASSPPGASARTGLRVEGSRRTTVATSLPFTPAELRKVRDVLAPLHARREAPKPGEWLADHPEDGQSFERYLKADPTLPTEERRTIVVQPLGELAEAHTRIVELASEYLGLHFGLPTRRAAPHALTTIPASAKRMNFGSQQILTRWLLQTVLPHRLPGDAAALVAFIASDLWPGDNWNYVFGQASLTARVGVWSLHRYGDPAAGEASFRVALLRALKIAVHETGHMFSLEHCTAYHCVQSGVNSLDEADESPLWLCPECLAKISWATRTDPREHLEKTAAFCGRHGLDREAAFLQRSRAALG